MRHRWRFPDLTDSQRSLCQRVSQATGFPLDAVLFVFVALGRLLQNRDQPEPGQEAPEPIAARELCEYMAQYAVELTGSRAVALDAFYFWRLRRGEDVGPIVLALVDAGLAGPQCPRDWASFRDVPLLRSLAQEPGEWPFGPPASHIRIVRAPAGDAPEEVRAMWIGLVLPLAKGETSARYFWTSSVQSATPRPRLKKCYAVEATAAIDILARSAPKAAAWWRQHNPQILQDGRPLLFSAEVCQEEGPTDQPPVLL
jgi:hypothetical protein